MKILIVILTVALIHQGSSICPNPQKAVYLSYQTLSKKDSLGKMFQNFSTSQYTLSYIDLQKRSYLISNLSYKLQYNSHYEKQEYVGSKIVKVTLGPIAILSTFRYSIKETNSTLYEGTAFVRSFLDYSTFQKRLATNNNYLEWEVVIMQRLTFSSLMAIDGVSYLLPNANKLVLEKMMNGIYGGTQLREQIQAQINSLYAIKLKETLGSQKLIDLSNIQYAYKDVKISISHQISSMIVDQNGVQIFLSFGALNPVKQQTNCSKLPPSFDSDQFGGIQQVLTFNSIKNIIQQSIYKGVYNITLDRSWQVQIFQLYMGDLANAIPYADYFNANSPIFISCSPTSQSNSTVSPLDDARILVQVAQRCTIRNQSSELVAVQIQLIWIVKLIAEQNYLSVQFDRFQCRTIKFIPIDPMFEVQRKQVGEAIINGILSGLISKQTFGSKFPILQRKYPGVFINSEHIFFFDHSQIYY